MKTSLTKLSSSFFALSISFSVLATPVAQVIDVTGTVFMVSGEGKTSILKVNEHLNEKAEILVEEGAQITLSDYYDTTYHLTGGTHLKFYNRSVQLKKGKTWIQSRNKRHPLDLTTANGHVIYMKSEFIATFDQTNSRSQVLVVNGEVDVSNILNKELKYSVRAGNFTILDPDIENGVPRSPTKVGLQSLHAALGEFKKLPEVMKETPISRSIASVEEEPIKKGRIIFIKSHRMPASVMGHKSKVKSQKAAYTPVPIRFYGVSKDKSEPTRGHRVPASIPSISPKVPRKSPSEIKMDTAFSESLKTHEVKQPKLSKELESLIHDLKSF